MAAGLCLSAPAIAAEATLQVDLESKPASEAVRDLGRQLGISIGYRDPAIAARRLRRVHGRASVDEALQRAVSRTGLQIRKIAHRTYLLEAAPVRHHPADSQQRPARIAKGEPPEAQPPVREDIVVTASKRSVPLANYAGSAQIVSGDDISHAAASGGSKAITTLLAGVTSTDLGDGRDKLFIRGIADSSIVGPTQATVGQYWGENRINYSAADPSLRLHDIARIEVLEGPQGTLYGAGSLGGILRVVPNAPDSGYAGGAVWGGAEAITHGSPGYDAGGMLNVPVVADRLALRAVGYAELAGGYIDDTGRDLHDVNEARTLGGRMALRWTPDSDSTIDMGGLWQRIRGDDGQYADGDGDGLSRATPAAQPYANRYGLVDLTVARQLGAIRLTTSLAYSRQGVFDRFVGAALADVIHQDVQPAADAVDAVYTQRNRVGMGRGEIRLSRQGEAGSGWLVGLSLLDSTSRIRRRMGNEAGSPRLIGVRNHVGEATVFGEYTWRPAPNLAATAGARVSWTRLSGRSEDPPSLAIREAAIAEGAARTARRLLPSASLAWWPGDSVTLYARYQQGFRPGGISVENGGVRRFASDRVKTYEAGMRYGGSGLSTSLSISWTRWLDVQADVIDGFGFPTTINIGNGRVLTIGWTTEWRPLPQLRLHAALYVNDGDLTRPNTLVAQLLKRAGKGENLPNVARISAYLAGAWGGEIRGLGPFDLSGYARYIGKSTLGVGQVLGREQGGYVDTGMALRFGDSRHGVSLTLTNLFDARGNRFALGSPLQLREENQTTPLQPRSLRIGFDYRF